MDMLENERKKEKIWVTALGHMAMSDFEELEHVAKLPLSVDEFDLIVKKYSGKYYFIDRLLCKIAEVTVSIPILYQYSQKSARNLRLWLKLKNT